MSTFQETPWQYDYKNWRTPLYKEIIYYISRGIISRRARKYLPDKSLPLNPNLVFFSRGTPPQWRRKWGTKSLNLRGATILVQGTGTGWDALTWAEKRPARIFATDLYEFANSWQEIEKYARDTFGVPITFRQAPMEDHPFLGDGTVDLCTSHNVLEHCKNLPEVLSESRRVLRLGGLFFADYNPMWFGPGGDHFSGGRCLSEIYNHLLLDRDEYLSFFESNTGDIVDFQNGGRYVEIDLFSKLTTGEYMDIYKSSGLCIDSIIIELSDLAFEFQRTYPERYNILLEKMAGQCRPVDLTIKGNLVRLRRPL